MTGIVVVSGGWSDAEGAGEIGGRTWIPPGRRARQVRAMVRRATARVRRHIYVDHLGVRLHIDHVLERSVIQRTNRVIRCMSIYFS